MKQIQRKLLPPMEADDPKSRTPEAQAVDALKAAGWVRVSEDSWRPGPNARPPKVQGSVLAEVERLMGLYAKSPAWRVVVR